jgi:hypothetical protein
MFLQRVVRRVNQFAPNFTRPTAKYFTRPLLDTTSVPGCIPGSGSLRSCKPLEIGSRLYYGHGCRDGPTGEDTCWLQQVPLWGFLIYRCDYRSDDAWKTFINEWSNRVRCYLDEHLRRPEVSKKDIIHCQRGPFHTQQC